MGPLQHCDIVLASIMDGLLSYKAILRHSFVEPLSLSASCSAWSDLAVSSAIIGYKLCIQNP